MTTLPERLQDVLSAMREASPQCAGFADRIAALQPSVGGEVVPEVQATAPERIYLAVSDDEFDRDQPFIESSAAEVSWSTDEPVAVCVPYVRADLASPAQPSGFVLVPVEPTRRMTGAGQDEANKWPAVGYGISELGVIACWNAMLTAAQEAREQTDMIVLDKYADIARALGFPCDTWFGDPLASHEEIVARATKLAALQPGAPK